MYISKPGRQQLIIIITQTQDFQGSRSNFENGGAPLVTQYWGGHKTLFLTNLII